MVAAQQTSGGCQRGGAGPEREMHGVRGSTRTIATRTRTRRRRRRVHLPCLFTWTRYCRCLQIDCNRSPLSATQESKTSFYSKPRPTFVGPTGTSMTPLTGCVNAERAGIQAAEFERGDGARGRDLPRPFCRSR